MIKPVLDFDLKLKIFYPQKILIKILQIQVVFQVLHLKIIDCLLKIKDINIQPIENIAVPGWAKIEIPKILLEVEDFLILHSDLREELSKKFLPDDRIILLSNQVILLLDDRRGLRFEEKYSLETLLEDNEYRHCLKIV